MKALTPPPRNRVGRGGGEGELSCYAFNLLIIDSRHSLQRRVTGLSWELGKEKEAEPPDARYGQCP